MCADHNGMYWSGPYEGEGIILDLKPGQVLLERFTIRRLLGRGSISWVYLARDEVRAMEVALKVVPMASDVAADRVKHETRLNGHVIDYHHVVHVHDVHCAPYDELALLLVSMEYADSSLRQWLVQNRDDVARRRSEGMLLFKQACAGVQALHDAGIIHRDLKPENLLLINGILKVADLHLARRGCDPSSDHWTQRFGRTGHFVGTPAYMGPEQYAAAHPDDIDERADVYALGVILAEMQHPQCRPPFGGSYEQLRERHLHMAPPPLEGVDRNCARVVARCLQKKPADRYQTVGQLLEDLEARAEAAVPCSLEVDSQRRVDQQVDGLWGQAVECVAAARWAEATRLCHRILNLRADHEDAQRMLEEIQTRDQQARQFYAKIERGVGYQSLEELLHLLAEAVSIYPNHPDGRLVQNQLLSLTRQYEDTIQKAAAAIEGGQWQIARANLERARQIDPGSPAIARLCEFVNEVHLRIETMRNGIDAAVEQGQRDRALFLARNLDMYLRQMSQPESRPPEWRNMYAYDHPLRNAYRLARQICANVLGGARRADRD